MVSLIFIVFSSAPAIRIINNAGGINNDKQTDLVNLVLFIVAIGFILDTIEMVFIFPLHNARYDAILEENLQKIIELSMPTDESWIVRRESWLPPFPLKRRY